MIHTTGNPGDRLKKKMISSTILFFCESALDDKRTHYVAGKE